jgi:hypothetical protein
LSIGDPVAAGLYLPQPGGELVEPGGELAVPGRDLVRSGGRFGEAGEELVALAGVDRSQALTGTSADRVGSADRVALKGLDDHAEAVDGLGDLVVRGSEASGQRCRTVTQLAGPVSGLTRSVGGLTEAAGDPLASVAELGRTIFDLPDTGGDLVEGISQVARPGCELL